MEKYCNKRRNWPKIYKNVTGQLLLDMANSGPMHDKIIEYFYLNLSTLLMMMGLVQSDCYYLYEHTHTHTQVHTGRGEGGGEGDSVNLKTYKRC